MIGMHLAELNVGRPAVLMLASGVFFVLVGCTTAPTQEISVRSKAYIDVGNTVTIGAAPIDLHEVGGLDGRDMQDWFDAPAPPTIQAADDVRIELHKGIIRGGFTPLDKDLMVLGDVHGLPTQVYENVNTYYVTAKTTSGKPFVGKDVLSVSSLADEFCNSHGLIPVSAGDGIGYVGASLDMFVLLEHCVPLGFERPSVTVEGYGRGR